MVNTDAARKGVLARQLFEILAKHPDGIQASKALEALAGRIVLTEYERGEFASGGRRFGRIVSFAKIPCFKTGWMVKRKGIWTVS